MICNLKSKSWHPSGVIVYSIYTWVAVAGAPAVLPKHLANCSAGCYGAARAKVKF